MPDIGEGYSEDGFTRQRRNLIVGSMILLFIHLADVQLGKQGSLFGIPITIGMPDAIQWFLYVGVLYWAWRFYTFHVRRHPVEMQTAARERMRRYLHPYALDCIIPSRPQFPPPDVPEGTPYELIPHDFGITNYQRDRIEAHLNPAWLITRPDGNKEIRSIGDQKALFKGRVMWAARILGYVKASLNTPAFSEYLLPYIVFVVSIGYATYRLMR